VKTREIMPGLQDVTVRKGKRETIHTIVNKFRERRYWARKKKISDEKLYDIGARLEYSLESPLDALHRN
jgi:hypothetical protein